MAKLVCRSGPAAGTEYPLTKDITLLGRQSSCDVQVEDTMASRAHCQVRRDGHLFTLVDLGSRNGTLHNGRKVGERSLLYGDRIRIGECEYVLVKAAGDRDLKDMLSKYEVIDRLGEGGMGIVYKAVQRSMARTVALKVLAPKYASKPRFVDQFVREARAAGTLNHANIIQVHDVGQENGIYFFSMEYVDGPTCMQVLRESGPFAPGDALEVVKQVAKALEYAHGHRLIHQDIKPDNIMLTAQGQVKLADLGISKTFDEAEAETTPKRVMGTPHYMAPEAALGKRIDHRVDIYSLGATLYQLLTGKTPYSGTSATEVLKAQVMDPFPPVQDLAPDVPDEVCDLVEQMTAKDPDQRLSTATAVVDGITRLEGLPGLRKERITQGTSGTLRQYAERAAPDRTPAQDPEGTREHDSGSLPTAPGGRKALLIVAGVVIIAAAAAAVALWPKPQPSVPAPPERPTPPVAIQPPPATAPVAPVAPTIVADDPRLVELRQIESALAGSRPSGLDALAVRVQALLSAGGLPPDLRIRAEQQQQRVRLLLRQQADEEAARRLDELDRQVSDLAARRNFAAAQALLDARADEPGAAARIAAMRTRLGKAREAAVTELRGRIQRAASDDAKLRQLLTELPAGIDGGELEKEIATARQALADAREREREAEVKALATLLGQWKLAELEAQHARIRPGLGDGPSAGAADQHLAHARTLLAMVRRGGELLSTGAARITGRIGTFDLPDATGMSERGVALRSSIGTVELRWVDLTADEAQRVVTAVFGSSGESYKAAVAAAAALKPAK